MRRLCLALCVFAPAARAFAADPAIKDIFKFYEDEMVTIAAKRPQTTRQAPGIVTVVAREEFRALGARDLIDVLELVPGFGFGVDTEGVSGAGFRGIWGQEGKILLMIDGQPMNEIDYGTLQFGHHYPLDNVQRIEVVRGPGSVVYGGFAEIAVVNLISRSPEQLDGGAVSFLHGHFPRFAGRTEVSAAAGAASTRVEGLSGSLSGTFGSGSRSDRRYTDFQGADYNLGGVNTLDPQFLNGSLAYKGLKLRFIYDGYRVGTRDGYGDVISRVETTFQSYYGEAVYAWKVRPDLVITPQVNYQWQKPWMVLDKASALFGNRRLQRWTGTLGAAYDARSDVHLLGGVSAYEERDELDDADLVGSQRQFDGGLNSIRYRNIAAYAQVFYENPIADVSVGAREESHNKYGPSFVPRAGLTKTWGAWHAKLLYSQAFRAPVAQNIALNSGIKPERTTTWETELGWRGAEDLALTANFFDITIRNPIIYTSSSTGAEFYNNLLQTGSRGFELAAKLNRSWGWAAGSYSFSSSAGKNYVDQYSVGGRLDIMTGLAQQKATVSASVKTISRLKVAPSVVWIGERYAYTHLGSAGAAQMERISPVPLLNLFLSFDDAFVKGLSLGAGAHNIANVDNPIPQPYNGGHPPLPGSGRELTARVTWSFGGARN